MDLSALTSISSLTAGNAVNGLTNSSLIADSFPVTKEGKKTDGTMFDAILNTAIENINTTNAYLSDYENEEIKWALGEAELECLETFDGDTFGPANNQSERIFVIAKECTKEKR